MNAIGTTARKRGAGRDLPRVDEVTETPDRNPGFVDSSIRQMRARFAIGELSAALEKAPGQGGHNRKALPNGGKSLMVFVARRSGGTWSILHGVRPCLDYPRGPVRNGTSTIKDRQELAKLRQCRNVTGMGMGMSNAERQRRHRRRQRAYLKNLERHADNIDRLERLLERVLKAELKPPLRREIERALERLRDPRLASAPGRP